MMHANDFSNMDLTELELAMQKNKRKDSARVDQVV